MSGPTKTCLDSSKASSRGTPVRLARPERIGVLGWLAAAQSEPRPLLAVSPVFLPTGQGVMPPDSFNIVLRALGCWT